MSHIDLRVVSDICHFSEMTGMVLQIVLEFFLREKKKRHFKGVELLQLLLFYADIRLAAQ